MLMLLRLVAAGKFVPVGELVTKSQWLGSLAWKAMYNAPFAVPRAGDDPMAMLGYAVEAPKLPLLEEFIYRTFRVSLLRNATYKLLLYAASEGEALVESLVGEVEKLTPSEDYPIQRVLLESLAWKAT